VNPLRNLQGPTVMGISTITKCHQKTRIPRRERAVAIYAATSARFAGFERPDGLLMDLVSRSRCHAHPRARGSSVHALSGTIAPKAGPHL
ncbi:MAG: hypothetical protein M3Y72_27125, partial [Acidobacteriota bacterium]|nr:hypothetical protein [Acidobacteriota bacterium]